MKSTVCPEKRNPILAKREFGKDEGIIHEAVVTGRKVGAGQEFWSSIAHNQSLFERVVAFVAGGGLNFNTTTIDQVQKIMNPSWHFINLENVIRTFGVTFSDPELDYLTVIPFSEAILTKRQNTDVLFPGYPLSVIEISRRLVLFKGGTISFNIPEWMEEAEYITKEKVDLRWYLIQKEILVSLANQTYDQQIEKLDKDENLPRLCEMVYLMTLYYSLFKTSLFEGSKVRCREIGPAETHVVVEFKDKGIINIGCEPDSRKDRKISTTLSQKLYI